MTSRRFSTRRSVLAATALLTLSAVPAFAQATEAEARRLQGVAETYLGKAPAGQPATATVVAEGDHYRAKIDLGLLARRLMSVIPEKDRKTFELEAGEVAVSIAPRGDGTWRFWDYAMPKLVTRMDGQVSEVVTEGMEFETITDPATGVTPSMKGRIARITSTSTIAKPGEALRVTASNTSTDITLDGMARATAEAGVVDMAIRSSTGGYTYTVGLEGGAATGVPDMTFTLKSGRQDGAAGLRGFRNAALLDLWAHLVAHHEPSDFTTGQGAFKAKLAAALPLFTDMNQKVSVATIGFQSPFGIASADKVNLDLDLAGLTREGRFGLALDFGGFQAHSLFMPKWAQKLVPADVALRGKVSGYDVATPLNLFLSAADFTAAKPLTDEQSARIATTFMPTGSVDIVLDGNRIANGVYDIALDGRLAAGPKGVKGAVTVRAKGIDAIADALADPSADDQARRLGGAVAMARQFAERKGDELVWRFDLDGDHVAVNGKPLK